MGPPEWFIAFKTGMEARVSDLENQLEDKKSSMAALEGALQRERNHRGEMEKDNVEKGKQKVAELTSDEIERRVSELNEAISEAEGLVQPKAIQRAKNAIARKASKR